METWNLTSTIDLVPRVNETCAGRGVDGRVISGPGFGFPWESIELQRCRKKLVILRKRIAGLSQATLERFVLRARKAVNLRGTVNVLVTNSVELRGLNRRFRGADKATDVLSFPATLFQSTGKQLAGELAISVDIARENSRTLEHSLAEEIKILVLHGMLHLAGFDHERDRGEMARKESRLRRQLKLETGLIERTQSHNRSGSAALWSTASARDSRRKTA